MPVPPLRVAIIGCGSAGPAVALWLARAGHAVEIFERAPALAPVGTGFLLQPTGLWALEELGLRAEVERHGASVTGLRARTPSGRRVLDLAYDDIAPGAHALGMHRATLLTTLVAATEREGVSLHLDAEVQDAPLDDGARWLEVDGARLGPFDLVIVAGGARCPGRAWAGPVRRERSYPWGALWTIAADRERRFTGALFQVVDGTRAMVGILPTGTRSDDPERTPLVSLFWSVHRDRVDDVRRAGREALEAAILELEPTAEPVLAEIDSMHRWSWAEYWDVVMRRWHGPGIAVLGDAAHAMSPQLGQGVNLALWDARELALCLVLEADLDSALHRYTRSRRRHLAFYQRATRWLTPLFQSSIPGAGALRDVGLPVAARIPWIERQMVLSMAGLKTGWWSALPWRDEPSRIETTVADAE